LLLLSCCGAPHLAEHSLCSSSQERIKEQEEAERELASQLSQERKQRADLEQRLEAEKQRCAELQQQLADAVGKVGSAVNSEVDHQGVPLRLGCNPFPLQADKHQQELQAAAEAAAQQAVAHQTSVGTINKAHADQVKSRCRKLLGATACYPLVLPTKSNLCSPPKDTLLETVQVAQLDGQIDQLNGQVDQLSGQVERYRREKKQLLNALEKREKVGSNPLLNWHN
jgi:TolA-binding protein